MRKRTPEDDAGTTIGRFMADRPLAHEVLFAGPRHKNLRPAFHVELINDFHSQDEALRFLVWIVFRGGGKSTIAEEGTTIEGWLREFRHAFIIGASMPKAQERLHAVRRMYERNEPGRHLFGDVRSAPWGDDRLELSTGQTIQAMGRGQAIRGTKNEDFRPDLIIVDDIEDAQSVLSPEGRKKVADWFLDELLPSGDAPSLRVRMLANDTHPECLANQLAKPGSGFVVKRYPWIYRDRETGLDTATWPDRFPLEAIAKTREQYYSQGKAGLYNSNYLCRSEAPEDKPFRREMFRYAGRDGVDPCVRRPHHPVYVMYDPARTTRVTSATTGKAVWSRIENRLVVWEGEAKRMMPDEIIADIFATWETYGPVKIGFEEDGLNEWALQPIRLECARRGVMLPLERIKAPKSKFDFIRGLQFGFNAREIIFAKPMHELEAQLLGFPSGHIDAPNALAYSNHAKLSGGVPVYDDFGERHVAANLGTASGQPLFLCLNATPGLVTAVLVQPVDGGLRILADWVREGDPPAVVLDIHRQAGLEAERGYRAVAGPEHFEHYGNHGLVQAYKKFGGEVRRAPAPERGREELRQLLRRTVRGQPAVQVAARARWALNALAGGYARAVVRTQVMDYPEEGTYRILMEGLESFLGMMQSVGDEAPDGQVNATAPDGRRFFSAVSHRRDQEAR